MRKTAEQIVKRLADWSRKYPRGTVYPMSKQSMDDELIEIEKEAKEYTEQPCEFSSQEVSFAVERALAEKKDVAVKFAEWCTTSKDISSRPYFDDEPKTWRCLDVSIKDFVLTTDLFDYFITHVYGKGE